MTGHYVLIDYENVQPKNLAMLAEHPFKVIVFVGTNQTKIPIDLAVAMQAMGGKAQYLKISGNGQNALDFHIAFYIGEISAREPTADFQIVSKDTGFDPLIRHLRDRKIRIHRVKALTEIPLLRAPNTKSDESKTEAIVKQLVRLAQSRPRKVKTLTNTINAMFGKKLGEAEIVSLIEDLEQDGHIVINQGNVSYRLQA